MKNNNKKIIRMCIVTRKVFKREDMIRIIKNKNGEYVIGNANDVNIGRSAYVKNDSSLWNKIYSKKPLHKSFKTKVPNYIYELLKKELYKYEKKPN